MVAPKKPDDGGITLPGWAVRIVAFFGPAAAVGFWIMVQQWAVQRDRADRMERDIAKLKQDHLDHLLNRNIHEPKVQHLQQQIDTLQRDIKRLERK